MFSQLLYDSKDLFVKELHIFLAQRVVDYHRRKWRQSGTRYVLHYSMSLLAFCMEEKEHWNPDITFGDAALQVREVMLLRF